MKELLIIEVKNFISNPKSTEFIKYDWDGGHCYSYIDHPTMDKLDEEDDLQELLNTWLYENDECPPCAIHINKDGSIRSSCGCHDDQHASEECIQGVLVELIELEKNGYTYLITVD